MSKKINLLLTSNKFKYTVLSILSLLAVTSMSFLVFSGIKSNKSNNKILNSSPNKTQIRNKFLTADPTAKINSIFINKTPDKMTTIYVGGTNLETSSSKTKGALAISTDNGKLWSTVKYFENPDKTKDQEATHNPIINKIMTEFYTDDTGLSDSIVISGEFLKSKPTENTGISPENKGNGVSSTAGQIAYDSIYYAKTKSTVNSIKAPEWRDVTGMDFDSSAKVNKMITGNSQKLNSISTVKMYSGKGQLQDHIYFVTNDENYDKTNVSQIPQPTVIGFKVFNAYDLWLDNSVDTSTAGYTNPIELSKYLNPQSIYSTVKSDRLTIDSQTNFNADMTSFVFMSNVFTDAIGTWNSKVYIVENQHFNANEAATTKAFDNPVFIEYTPGATSPVTYLGLDSTLKASSVIDNFLIKTISINPMTFFDDGKYDSAFLIFGGEKDNKSYMIDPVLVVAATKPSAIAIPTSTSKTANANGSFISKIIPFPYFTAKADPLNPTAVTKVIPLAVFGSNMDSSNNNIALPDSGYTPDTNTQGFTKQGLLFANIRLTTSASTDITEFSSKTSKVVYSQAPEYKTTNTVNFVDNSDNYYASSTPSMAAGYSFTVSDYSSASLSSSAWNTYKTSPDSNGNYTFVNTNIIPKKKFNKVIHIAIPVIVVVVIFFLMLLFMLEDILLGKGKKKNNLRGKGKNKKQIFKLLGLNKK